jgi:hypothetical protein
MVDDDGPFNCPGCRDHLAYGRLSSPFRGSAPYHSHYGARWFRGAYCRDCIWYEWPDNLVSSFSTKKLLAEKEDEIKHLAQGIEAGDRCHEWDSGVPHLELARTDLQVLEKELYLLECEADTLRAQIIAGQQDKSFNNRLLAEKETVARSAQTSLILLALGLPWDVAWPIAVLAFWIL